MTEDAAVFLSKHSTQVDVWALPGKHLGEYQQIVVAAVKGLQPDPERLYGQIMAQKADPTLAGGAARTSLQAATRAG